MSLFILRKVVLLMITLFLLSVISFSLCYFTPHGPLSGTPLADAFVFWYKGLLQFDFGISQINRQPVSQQLMEVLPATLELCLLAGLLATFCGLPLGILAAFARGKWPDNLISGFALVGFSLPIFWLALLLTLLFSLTLGWLPVSGQINLLYSVPTVTGFSLIDAWLSDSDHHHQMLVSSLKHLILPMVTLSLAPMTEVIRLMRNSTLEVIDKGYIKAAFVRGLSRFTVIRRHVVHNALPPMIPHLGLQCSTLFALSMVTEVVFNWPGMGRWLLTAVRQEDYNTISAGVMVMGGIVIIINIIADIVGAMLDPLKHKDGYGQR